MWQMCKDKEACLRMDGLKECSIVLPEAVSSGPAVQMQQKAHVFSCVEYASLLPPAKNA